MQLNNSRAGIASGSVSSGVDSRQGGLPHKGVLTGCLVCWPPGVSLQGAVACNVQRTTYAIKITSTPSWVASATTIPTAWDGAVVGVT
jgi:hypothetical protein